MLGFFKRRREIKKLRADIRLARSIAESLQDSLMSRYEEEYNKAIEAQIQTILKRISGE